MDMKQYQQEYDKIWDGIWGPEDTVLDRPTYKPFEALLKVGPINGKRAEEIFITLRREANMNGAVRHPSTEKYGDGEMVVAVLGETEKKDRDLMLRLIEFNPRAYLYVHPSINDESFMVEAIRRNKSVFLLLPEEQRKDPYMIGLYRSECEGKNAPNRNVDPHDLFSVNYYKRLYERWIDRDDEKALAEMQFAEKINPDLAEQYEASKREVILEMNEDKDLGYRIYGKSIGCNQPLLGEIEKRCPELLDTVLRDYRIRHVDELIKETFDGTFDCYNWYEGAREIQKRAWLRENLLKWPETRDAAKHAVETNLRMTPQHNSTYAIDQMSLYAYLAKHALMHFKGMSEKEAVAMVRNSTQEQIEAQVGVKQIMSNTIWAIGAVLKYDKDVIQGIEQDAFDTRGKPLPTYLSNKIMFSIDDIRKKINRKPGTDQLIDEAVIAALKEIGISRTNSSASQAEELSLQQIKETEMRDDMLFARHILPLMGLEIDMRVVEQFYDRRADYANKYPHLEEKGAMDKLLEFVSRNEEAVLAAILRDPALAENLIRALAENGNVQNMNIVINTQSNEMNIGNGTEDQSGYETPGNR